VLHSAVEYLLLLEKFFLKKGICTVGRNVGLGSDRNCRALVAQLAEQMFERMAELGGGTVYGLIESRGVVSHGNRLVTLWTGFHLATHVVAAALVTVFVFEMDFYASQVLFEPFESRFDRGTDPVLQTDTVLDVVVAIDLDLHG
jgi:hypothetical protein